MPRTADLAHTPDALRAVLRTLRAVTGGRPHAVIGCGGGRDTTKRAVMGEIAACFTDTAILTADNPRSEDPAAISAAMLGGAGAVPTHERGELLVIADRAEAIAAAVARARPGDTVLIARKGHESGQRVGVATFPFDDRAVLREAITATGHFTCRAARRRGRAAWASDPS